MKSRSVVGISSLSDSEIAEELNIIEMCHTPLREYESRKLMLRNELIKRGYTFKEVDVNAK